MSLQPSKPLEATMAVLLVLLDSRDNPDRGRPAHFRGYDNPTASHQLSRIRELPTIRLLAEQLGLCRPGEFVAATVHAIADRLCEYGRIGQERIDQPTAFRLKLSVVVQFLEGLVAQSRQTGMRPPPAMKPAEGRGESKQGEPDSAASGGQSGRAGEGVNDPHRWLSLADAARISGINRGVISRAVDTGKLKGNGEQGKGKRKIDAVDFTRWLLERANKPEPTESAAQVAKQVRKHVKNGPARPS